VGAFKSHWWYPLASVECAGSDFGIDSTATKVNRQSNTCPMARGKFSEQTSVEISEILMKQIVYEVDHSPHA
jgi:hypothetical protein